MKKWLIFLFGIIFLISIVSADTNVSDIYIQTTSNITLGQKITFALGEIIDNIIDGWMTITGNLDVRGFGNFSGTIYINNNSDISLFNETDRLNSINSSFLLANTSLYARIGVLNSTIINSNASWLSTHNATYHNFVIANLTNISNYWDGLDTFNATQMEESDQKLNIKESWLKAFINFFNFITNENVAYKNQSNVFVPEQNFTGNINSEGNIDIWFP